MQLGSNSSSFPAPLGQAQEFEWWKQQDARLRSGSNIKFTLTPSSPLSIDQASSVVTILQSRHEALRTRITLGPDGNPGQTVSLPDWGEFTFLRRAAEGDTALPDSFTEPEFDLAEENPIRVAAIVRDNLVTDVGFVISHCVFDGSSVDLLSSDFSAVVDHVRSGLPLPEVPGRQPHESAWEERWNSAARRVESAVGFWATAVRELPNRMSAPTRTGVMERHGAKYTSDRLAQLMVLLSRKYRTTPAVAYIATINALLGVMSEAPRSSVRTHFSGRSQADASTVGCLHRILPISVDTSDRPDFGTLIRRVSMQSLRVQSRSGIGFLKLRELICSEERRRGVFISEGSTVNVTFGNDFAELRKQDEQSLFTALGAAVGEVELLMGRNETSSDVRGLDCYLMADVSRSKSEVFASFNAAVFTPSQMRSLLIGPEKLLDAQLRQDLSWDAVREISQCGPPLRASGRCVRRVGSDLVHLGEVDKLLARHPAVRQAESAVFARDDGGDELVSTVFCQPSAVRTDLAAELRELVACHVRPGTLLVVPQRFRFREVENSPLPLADAGVEGVSGTVSKSTECHSGVQLLERLVADANILSAVDPDRSYIENGGSLVRVPRIIASLRAAGHMEVGAYEFTLPISIRSLALYLGR